MELEVKTLDGAVAGTVALSDEIFGLEPRADILQRVVRWQLAKRQAGTHKAQGRSEVTRTGKKMYRQKGTGGARHGNKAAPQFRGGGKAFGPVVHSHAHDLPKKVRALGLKLALSAKAKDAAIVILDQAVAADHKTKTLKGKLDALGLKSALIIDGIAPQDEFRLAARAIAEIDVLPVQGINVYDILRRDTLVLTKAAVTALEERFK
jgi:large subunit ribosomal protein L4